MTGKTARHTADHLEDSTASQTAKATGGVPRFCVLISAVMVT